jgi:hypothetical protein
MAGHAEDPEGLVYFWPFRPSFVPLPGPRFVPTNRSGNPLRPLLADGDLFSHRQPGPFGQLTYSQFSSQLKEVAGFSSQLKGLASRSVSNRMPKVSVRPRRSRSYARSSRNSSEVSDEGGVDEK